MAIITSIMGNVSNVSNFSNISTSQYFGASEKFLTYPPKFMSGFYRVNEFFLDQDTKSVLVNELTKDAVAHALFENTKLTKEMIEEVLDEINFECKNMDLSKYKGVFFFDPGYPNHSENRIDAGYGHMVVETSSNSETRLNASNDDSNYYKKPKDCYINIRVDKSVDFF